MKAYVFPGQGAQFVGMGKDLYEGNAECRAMFEKANEILTISEDKNCVGVCKIEIYGKRTHLLNLEQLFDD